MRVLGIAGSVTSPSRTRAAVDAALEAAAELDGVSTETLHLAEYDLETADGRTLEEYGGDTAAALDLVIESDAYVVGTPVYRASYSGALKNLFDLVPRGQWQADVAPLENSAVGLIATGGSDHHYLSIDEELRPITAFFGAHAVGGSVYATSDAFEDGDVADEEIRDRLEKLGGATVELARAVDDSEHLSTLGPSI